jgi:5-methyltetrahydrofolate--homocysteine methyltransferase
LHLTAPEEVTHDLHAFEQHVVHDVERAHRAERFVELNERGLSDFPVLLGGAALTRTYVERDLRDIYEGRLFYGKDAFEGLHTMDRLMEIKRTGEDDPDFGRVLGGRNLPARAAKPEVDPSTIPTRSPEVTTENELFKPPWIGTEVVKGIPIDEIATYLNETAIFRNQWQFRPERDASGKMESDEEFKTRIRPILREQLADAKAKNVLVPQVVYGYFPVNGDGQDVVVWADESRTEERTRFWFPRQQTEPYLCIADFFRPVDSGEADYAAFMIVSMGSKVSELTAELFAANKYQDYLLLHGLSVEMAEALAEMWHRRIREEMGFADEDGPSLAGLFRQRYRGGRYSWGYPACPDLEDNARVWELLDASRIGVEVGEGFQYHPEQTTSAIICHHPQAKYFVA